MQHFSLMWWAHVVFLGLLGYHACKIDAAWTFRSTWLHGLPAIIISGHLRIVPSDTLNSVPLV